MGYGLSYHETVLLDSPVAYYRMSEGGGLVLQDTSGNGRVGTYAGGVTLAQPGAVVNSSDSAALFDGSTGFATVPDDNALDLGDVVTVEAWVRQTAAGSSGAVLNKGATAYGLRLNAGVPTFAKSETADIVAATVNLDDLAWHHVVATKNAATNVLYVDGVDRSGAVTNATLADTAIALQIGRLSGGTSFFRGYLDEVAVYGTALPAARVLAHFLRGMNIRAGAAAIPSRCQTAAVLYADGAAAPANRPRYASYGAGVLTPGTALKGVAVVGEGGGKANQLAATLTRFSAGTPIPAFYGVISETAVDD